MAAKSDFAQKLLHDLRLRKERMGASQGSARNHATPRDAYRDPGHLNRGSQQPKSLNSIGGSKSMNQQLISSTEASQQLVTYSGRHHRRSESTGDLSMAFTFKNGQNYMNMDFSTTNTMIDFLNQIGRRSLHAGNATSLVKHGSSNGGLTSIQIKEISKGVQNLYEIIRSTSDGRNVNRYSMEVGKELLKGAKGLEESLRMLVNLQEASELMVKPKRKSRITLLEVDDDDDGENERLKNDRNQVALPRFSFDKPSKKQNLPVADGNVKFSGHRRAASGDVESVQSVSCEKPTSNRSEKGRISNVIAKLMGLEEIPVKADSYPGRDEIKTAIPVRVKVESCSRRDETKKVDDLHKSTVKKTSRPVIKDVVVSLNDRKPEKNQDLITSQESRMNQSNKNKEAKSESKEKMHSKRRIPEEAAVNLQVEKKKTVRSSEIKLVSRNNQIQEAERRTQRSKQDSKQMKAVKNTNLDSKELKPQPFECDQKVKDSSSTQRAQEQERAEQKMVTVTRKKVDAVAVGRTESPRTKDEVLKRRNRTINNLSMPSKNKLSVFKETRRNEGEICSEPEAINLKIFDSFLNANEAESTTRLHDIVPICENEMNHSDPQIIPEITVSGKSTEIVKHNNLLESKPKKALHSSIQVVLTEQEKQGKNTGVTRYAKLKEIKPEKALYSSVQVTVTEQVKQGKNTGTANRRNMLENKVKKAFHLSVRVVLTEQEKQLKEILIRDQLFLSTAETLFKLNIPVGFLHVDDHEHHDNETKLKLDCGYEILKRKARNQELSVHPYVKPFVVDTSIRFLDELVKQLYKNLEVLRVYGRDTRNEYDEADYLHHMLEKDIHNKYPDINSFWDFGWHALTFTFVEKDEFVSDVEQDVFHILIDEIVEDLLSI